MSWTHERVELLKKLWSDGLSASRIAAELGGITRNAVIGKVHRLRLSGRAKSESTVASHQRKARSSSRMQRMSRASINGNTALAHAYDYDAEATPQSIENIIPIGQRRSLVELTEQTCHWPIGDPCSSDFIFCGGNTVTGQPYCAYHCRIAIGRRLVATGRLPPTSRILLAFFPRQNSAHALHQPASILHAGDVFGVAPRDSPHVLAPGLEVILAQAPAHHLTRDALVRGELDQLAGDSNGRGRREASRRPSPPARLPLCPRACGALPGAPLRRDGFWR